MTAIGGMGVAALCSIGCLTGIWLCNRMALRTVYVVTGLAGAAFALALIWTPHTLAYFAAGVLGYNFCQGVNYTSFTSLGFEIVGPGNPLAATQFSLLMAAGNLPISYMTALDGHVYGLDGLGGMLATDAGMSVLAGTALLLLFLALDRRHAQRQSLAAQSGV